MTENTTNSELNMYYRSVKEKNENLKPKNDFNTEEQKNILKMISSIKFSTSYDITALKNCDLKLVKIPVNEHEFVLFMMITSKKT